MLSAASSVGTAVEHLRRDAELLTRVHDLGLLARPAREEVGLRACRLDRLDGLQPGDGDPLQARRVGDQPTVDVGAPARDRAQREEVGDREHDRRAPSAAGRSRHEDEVEDDRDAGSAGVVASWLESSSAIRSFSSSRATTCPGVALHEERRSAAAAHATGSASTSTARAWSRGASSVACWIQVRAPRDHAREREAAGDRREPARPSRRPRTWSTKIFRNAADARPGTISARPASRHRARAPAVPPRSRVASPRATDGGSPPFAKSGPGLEDEHHAGERPVELLPRDAPRAGRRDRSGRRPWGRPPPRRRSG